MDEAQELEWLEAQKIVISVDLVAAAKHQLEFLAAVDRNRCLYDGPVLHKAIHRYKTCWLPLLAKHSESSVLEGPLVVPLDCEWVWHCHRLNPVQYKADCEKFYGQILDNSSVVSVMQGTSKQKTMEIWDKLFPEEPYELDCNSVPGDNSPEKPCSTMQNINYDLVSAVKRQSTFFYQVSTPSMNDDRFLEGSVARYKGFLHLIRRNMKMSMRRFCVPTYDIDLIWHSHQLQPLSYCKDLLDAVGKILEHDDTDSDRAKGRKLDVGFSGTTKQWEETFGLRYWRAGAMYRGNAPSPVTVIPWPTHDMGKHAVSCAEHQKQLHVSQAKVVEVLLEIIGIRNLPANHEGTLCVSLNKSQPDIFLSTNRKLSIFSESGEKQLASFQCEPTGELVFTLISYSHFQSPVSRPAKTMGKISFSLEHLLEPDSKLSVQKWFELSPCSDIQDSNPISLLIALSFTVPSLSPYVLRMVQSRPFSANTCFPLPRRVQQLKCWTSMMDINGNETISMHMRNVENSGARKKEVIGLVGCTGETYVLAEFVGTEWSLLNSQWFLHLEKKHGQGVHNIELRGHRSVKIFPGRKLEYEPKDCANQKQEYEFMTVVEFSTKDPYGIAVALLNLKSGLLKVNADWFILPAILLACILSSDLRQEGDKGAIQNEEYINTFAGLNEEANNLHVSASVDEAVEAEKGNAMVPKSGGGCGAGCGSGCGSGCGGGCGNVMKSSGCGGCGNIINSGGCGGCGSGGCGSGCGNIINSSSCGGCGGSCGEMVKS